MAGGAALVGVCLLMLLGEENRDLHAMAASPETLRLQLATSFHATYWLVGSHLTCTSLLFLALAVHRQISAVALAAIEVQLQPQSEHTRPPAQLPGASSCL